MSTPTTDPTEASTEVETFTYIALGRKGWGVGNTQIEAIYQLRLANTGDKPIALGQWSDPVSEVTVNAFGDIKWVNADAELTWIRDNR